MERLKDIIYTKIGLLRVISYEVRTVKGKQRVFYSCVCDCGNSVKRERWSLKNNPNSIKSCGCFKVSFLKSLRTKHNMTESRFYKVWCSMKGRVLNVNNPKYKDYGGRGVSICGEWMEFDGFKNDMYKSYLEHVGLFGEKDTTLERKDVNGNYNKENCTWATIAEQNQNRRINKKFIATNIKTGETYIRNNRKKFAEEIGISDKHIGSVLNGKRKTCHGFTFSYLPLNER